MQAQGVCGIAFAPQPPDPTQTTVNATALGYIMVIISASLYAAYRVLYKRYGLREDEVQSSFVSFMRAFQLLGLMGFWSVVLAWPGILICQYTGIETFALPQGADIWRLVVAVILEALFNVLLLIGIMLTSPLFIAIGNSLTIPASIVADYLLHGYMMSAQAFGGTALVLAGFLGLNLSDWLDQRRESIALRGVDAASVAASALDINADIEPLILAETARPPPWLRWRFWRLDVL